ncbi:hypothetical protein JM946_29450 [Steroidobacter sp. S1-65]|uniref:Uncharacterized protein n=1 Tax=Steroidobacter gossypii TaxID=2805490 RepID=A0ABS1X6M3_9GAMM|nr:hypothetical protein [Steroidobacter gossypii]MBM0108877.1 hypothetical protein [Steroidobacter gossypii]
MIPLSQPHIGKVLRLVIFRDDVQVFNPWKFNVAGDDLYVTSRGSDGDFHHFSLHATGRIHYRMERKAVHLMRNATAIAGARGWMHAITFRFNPGSSDILKAKPVTTTRDVFKVDVPLGRVLQVDVLLQKPHDDKPLPLYSQHFRPVWERPLRSGGRILILIALSPLDDADAKFEAYVRDELRITVNKPPKNHSAEIMQIPDGSGANDVRITNAAPQTYRWNDPQPVNAAPARSVTVALKPAEAVLRAPNGVSVGTVMLTGCNASPSLHLEEEAEIDAGTFILRLFPEGLIRGSTFLLTPMYLSTSIRLCGVARHFHLRFRGSFDGDSFTVRVAKHSVGAPLRDENSAPMVERLSVVVPHEEITVSAALDAPITIRPIVGTVGRKVP